MNRLDYKLTLCLVSLFISFILLVIGCITKNGYCLCFGLCFSAVAIVLYSIRQLAKINKNINFLQQIIQNEDLSDMDLDDVTTQIKAQKKQRRQLIWGGFAFSVLLVIIGIACAI